MILSLFISVYAMSFATFAFNGINRHAKRFLAEKRDKSVCRD